MNKKTIPVSVTISRASDNNIYIRIKDETSRTDFVEVKFDYESFAKVITGLAYTNAIAEIRGLENVGKQFIRENRSVDCPLSSYGGKGILEKWLLDNCQESGWTIDTYLRSQNSIVHKAGYEGCVLNYSVYRYEEML